MVLLLCMWCADANELMNELAQAKEKAPSKTYWHCVHFCQYNKIIRESSHFNDNHTRTHTHAHNLLNSSAKSKKETTNTLRWSTTLEIYSVSRVVCIQEFLFLLAAAVVIGLCVVGVICGSLHIEIQGNGSYRTTNISQRWVINIYFLNNQINMWMCNKTM